MANNTSGSERNAPCSTCGKKMKQCPGHWSIPRWLIVALQLAIFTVLIGVVTHQWTVSMLEQREQKAIKNLKMVSHEYAKRHRMYQEQWWLETLPTFTAKEEELFKRRRNLLVEILGKNKNMNDLTRRITTAFPTFLLAYTDGKIVRSAETRTKTDDPNICFIPRDQIGSGHHPSMLYWDISSGSVIMAAIEMPESILPGVLFHELGHALRQRVDQSASATAPTTSDLYISEEVEMHDLEAYVDDAVNGKTYLAAVDGIVEQCHGTHPLDVMGVISSEDLERLDTILGAARVDGRIAGSVIIRHLYILGARAIERSNGGMEKINLAFYEDDKMNDKQPWHFWRLEGPGFVWNYRVLPHVHTFVNISGKA